MANRNQINLIKALAIKKGLDPAAVLAVARQEGLSGGIGDQGTSFGPFQLHVGGAFPQGIRGDKQSWAWGKAGLNYALSRMASVAAGQHGAEAINSIVRRFERPAAPENEIQGALAAYGNGGPVSAGLGSTTSVAPPAFGNPSNNRLLQAVLHGTDLNTVIRQNALQGPVSPVEPLSTPGSGLDSILSQVSPAELLNEGTGGPTHSTGPHIHAAYTNPQAMLAAIHLAEKLGLHLGENPYVGQVDPVHAPNSYHYRTFPGLYGGKKLGEAVDVSGPKAQTFYRMLLKGVH